MKLLIKLGILLAIFLSSLFGYSQSKSDKVYDMFSGEEGIVSLSFSKSVLKPFELFIDEDTKQVIYKMKKIRFMSYNEKKGDLNALEVYKRINKELSSDKYFKIDPEEFNCDDCNINVDSDGELSLIGHGNKKTMDEFHIILSDDELCLMFSFFGEITIEDLKEFGKFTNSTKDIVTM